MRSPRYWLRATSVPHIDLPLDHANGIAENTAARTRSIVVELSGRETKALLQQVPKAYGGDVPDVLLTAAARAIGTWAGSSSVLFDLEGHGREPFAEDLDLSRTVGWFTTSYPVALEAGHERDLGEALRSVKEVLRAIPHKGIGYGLLRYLVPDSEVGAQLAARPQPQISFNYLGRFDDTTQSTRLLTPVDAAIGQASSPKNARAHLIDINAVVRHGRLRVEWRFSEALHDEATVEALAGEFIGSVRQIVAHCAARHMRAFSPSDFPLACIGQRALDALQSRYGAAGIEDLYTPSPMQLGMLYHTLANPTLGEFVSQVSFTLEGPLNRPAFREAWQQVVNAHAILRSAFVLSQDEMHQVVCRRVSAGWLEEDWRRLTLDERRRRFDEFIDADRRRGFDLEQPPLLRVTLLHFERDVQQLVLTLHHSIMDGWSLPLVLQDVFTAYDAKCSGSDPVLQARRPFRDYIAWLRRRDTASDAAYWRETLQGFTASTKLPSATPASAVATSYGVQGVRLPQGPTTAVQRFARGHNLTLNTVIQGAWAALLARHSGDIDVVYGTTLSGRPIEISGVDSMIGVFINTLPMRVRVEGSVTAWLARLQEAQLELRDHEYTPLVDASRFSDVGAGQPLFESLFVFENYPVPVEPSVRADGLRVSDVRGLERANYPLAFVARAGAELSFQIIYDRRRFDDETIGRLLGHLRMIVEAMAAQPAGDVATLGMLTEAEAEQQLKQWNPTLADQDLALSIAARVERRAAEAPDAVAMVWGSAETTYRSLNRKANQLASHLRRHGVRRGSRVAVCFERGPSLVTSMLAVLKAGGAYVPLDPEYPRERLAFMVEDTAPRALLTEQRLAAILPPFAGPVVRLDADAPLIEAEPDANVPHAADAGDVAYVMHTSGSTGRPKGVAIPQRGIARLIDGADFVRLTPSDVIAQASNASFDAATFEIWGALVNGARLVGVPKHTALSPVLLAHHLREHRVTTLFLTTALFNQVARECPDAFAPLDHLLFGGEAVDPRAVAAVLASAPPRRLLHVYGPTENTTFSTWHLVTSVPEGATTVPIGRPIANSSIYVLDASLRLAPVGVAGELFVGGDGLATGYLNQPSLTAERFVPSPFDDGERLYRTGDLVRWRSDGQIEFLGRSDEQVKIRGYRIEPGEIEAVVAGHPSVHAAVVLVRETAPGVKQLVGYVVRETGSDLEIAGLRAYLKTKLPDYMVPAAIIELESLPLNANGKLDRDALPLPLTDRQDETTFQAPASDLEQRIAAIWQATLGLTSVGVRDNFFDLGGHSLLLIKVHALLVESLGANVRIVDLFQYPTVESLAGHLSGAVEARAATPARTGAPLPTSRAIAVIGMAGRFPGAADLDAFWNNLRSGVETIRFFTEEELTQAGIPDALLRDPKYVRARGMLENADRFDAAFFGYTPREAELMDPQHRVFLECAWHALENAACDPSRFDGRIGVYAGARPNSYALNQIDNPGLASAGPMQTLISTAGDFLPTRVSYKLNLRGPSVNVQTACSTSLVAVHQACQSLLTGDCDVALAGGVSVNVPGIAGYIYQEGGVVSPDGHCRAFDASARGAVSGDGVGIVVLKRLDEALANGDAIRAVIRGSAINNDGSLRVGFTAPSVEGQAEVLRLAYTAAGVDPASVSYVEAHGTGTALGDPIEVSALTQAFGAAGRSSGACAIGSVKTNVGHLNSAAGVAGLIKTILALEHREIPPSLHYERPNPRIDFQSRFAVNARLSPWPGDSTAPRRAGVSSFGMGGTNAHAVVEEAPTRSASSESRATQLLMVSGRTSGDLDRAAAQLAAHLSTTPASVLADVAYTLQIGRRGFRHRRVVRCDTLEQAIEALEGRSRSRSIAGTALPAKPVVAFLFPGQGSQELGMGCELYDADETFRREVDACSELFLAAGVDVREILLSTADQPGAASSPNRTLATEAALFTIELALARLWIDLGVKPSVCLGHGIGEYVAACVSDELSVEDAVSLIAARHVRETVPLSEGVRKLLDFGANVFVEVGPGRTLTTLVRQHADVVTVATLASADRMMPQPDRFFEALGRLWIAGIEPDWNRYYATETRLRVQLPGYPFTSERYWIERRNPSTDVAVRGVPVKTPNPAEWLYQPIWNQAVLEERAIDPRVRWIFIGDSDALAGAAALDLERRGAEVHRVPALEAQVLASALRSGGTARIVLGRDANQGGITRLVQLVRAIREQRVVDPIDLRIISCGACSVIGSERLDFDQAKLLGLVRVIPQEHPNVRCSLVDLDETTVGPGDLVAALTSASPPVVLALRGARAWKQAFERRRSTTASLAESRLVDGGTYLITDGLGKIGLAVAEHLVRSTRAKVVLVGRSKPSIVDRARIERMERNGGAVLIAHADVADPVGMREAIDNAERTLGSLSGVFHLADATHSASFRPVSDLDERVFAAQFRPKVEGARTLARVLAGRQLNFVVLSSSISTVLGGLGFGAYAAANAALESLAEEQSRDGSTPWISVAFDGWSFRDDSDRQGSDRFTLTPAEGLEVFDRVLALGGTTQVVVSSGDLGARIDRLGAPVDGPLAEAPRSSHARPVLSTEYAAPRGDDERKVAAVWEELLGIRPIGIHDNFFELGGHSLLGVQLIFRLTRLLGVSISVHQLFEAPSVATLVEVMSRDQAEQSAEAERIAEVLKEVGDMSDEDVERLLAQKV